MKRYTAVALLVAGLVLVWWTFGPKDQDPFASALAGADAEEAMALANTWKAEGKGVQSYVTPEAVVFRLSESREVKVPLPKDRMVVAVAPYVSFTHRCEVHFMSSCQGELAGEKVWIRVEDEGGQVVQEGEVTLLPNGFVELWLPRGKRYSFTARYNGLEARKTLTTFANSPTCVTDVPLTETPRDDS